MKKNAVTPPVVCRISAVPLLLVALVLLAQPLRRANAQTIIRDSQQRARIINDEAASFVDEIESERSVNQTRLYPWLLSLEAEPLRLSIAAPRATTGVSTWTGGTGNWSDGTMWNPSGAPNDATADVFVDGGNTAVNSSVSIDGNFTVGRLTIDSGDTVSLLDNRVFIITDSGGFSGAGSLVNNGTFNLSGGNDSTDLRINSATTGNVTVSGGGTISGSNTNNRIFGVNGNDLLTIGANQTVSGSLQFGINQLRFVNNGLIDANATGGISVDPTDAAGDAVNNGTMRASNGSTLTLQAGNYTNTSGTVAALTNSTVNVVSGATIAGGSITTTTLTGTGGVIQSLGGTFNNVTSTAYLSIPDNNVLFLSGTFTNNGVVALNGGNNSTDLRLSGDVTLAGSGSITSDGSGNNRIFSSAGGERLTIGTNATVQGAMQFGLNQTKFTNNGLIDSNTNAGAMQLDPSDSSGDAVNNGTMRASNGGTLNLSQGSYTNSGTISALTGSTVNLNSGAVINGGTITTTDLTGSGGVIQGLGGTLSNVTSTGYVNIPDNNVLFLSGTFTNNGTLMVNGGNNSTDIRLSGDVSIAGTGTIKTSNTQNNRIFGSGGGEQLTIGSGMSLQGSFQLGLNQTRYINNGVINANLSNGVTIDASDNVGDAINNGTIEASNGGTLNFLFGNYTNTNGTIAAQTGSTVSISNGAIISGGILTTTDLTGNGGEIISGNDATLTGVTNKGYLLNPDSHTLRLSGTLTNNGVLAMGGGNNNTDLRLIGDVTINGTGSFSTTNTQNNRIYGNGGGETLTIGTGVTLGGSFQFGVNQTKFVNNGTIDANQSSGVSFDPSDGASDAINNGTMQASNGSTLTLNTATYTNNGTIRALNNSTVNMINDALIVGGTLTTSGTGVVQTGNDASLQSVTNNGLLNIPDNTRLRLFNTLTNNGTLMMSGGNNNTELRIGTDLTLSGTGSLNTTNTQNNRFFGLAGSERLTIATGYTLQGSMQLGVNQMKFTNNGTINSNQSSGMSIDPTDAVGDAVNASIIEATNGSTLTLFFGNYTNTNGTIKALDGSTVNLRGDALIVGGTLTTQGSGVIQTINDASVQDITNSGLLNVPDNTRLRIFGTINNTGTIMLSGGNNNTELRIGNDVTLSGTGSITTTNTQNNRVFGISGSERLTIASGYTLSGSMQLGVNQMKFTNNGTINSNQSSGMSIDPTDAVGDAVNTSIIEATNGSTLTLLFGNYTNTNGTIEAIGAGSTVNMRDGATITGGTLTTSDLSGTNGVIQTINDAELQNLTNNGYVNIPDGTRLRLFGTITNNGIIQMSAGNNNAELRLDGDVTLAGSGTLQGSNTQNNHVLGLNSGNETLTNGAMHTISGTMQIGLNQMNLVNDGVINSNQTGGIVIDPTSTAMNDASGIFRASNGSTLSLINGTFTNNGTYEARDNSTLQMNSGASLTNYDSGSMTLTGGTYRAVSTGNPATLNLNIGQIVNNAATIILDGANTIIHTSDNSTDALTQFNNNTAGGSFTITNGRNFDRTFAFTNAGIVTVGPMSLFTTVQFDLSGTLTGAGTLTDSGPFNWTAGTQSGTGITNANGALNITTAANKFLDARTINAAATTTWSGADNISAGNGAILNNLAGGTFNAQAAQTISFSGIGTAATFNNAGTFAKSGAGTTTSIDAIFNDSGAANINSGTLALLHGGTDSGSFVDASGAALTFDGGTFELTGTSSTSGAGAVNFSLGTMTFDSGAVYNISGLTTINGGIANFNDSATGAATVLSSGTLAGSGSYSASGLLTWSGGTMSGSGTTNANGGLTMNGGTKTLVSRTLNNNGAATWSAGNISSGQGAKFSNNSSSTFDNSFDGSFLFDQGGARTSFANAGTFTKSAGSGVTLIEAAFNNTNVVNANSGTLRLAGGGTNSSAFNVASGATIQIALNDYTMADGAVVSGAGTLEMLSGNTDFSGVSQLNTANFLIDGGTMTVDSATNTTGNTTLSSGTITGAGVFVTDSLTWSGGTMNGSGGTTQVQTTLTMNGATKTLIAREIFLQFGATGTWSAGDIAAGQGAIFANSGSLTDSFDGNFLFNQGGAIPQFFNNGTFTKSGGTGTTLMQVEFANGGTLNVNSGTLAFLQGVQSNGSGNDTINIGSGATLDVSSGSLASSAGTLDVNGNLSLGSNNIRVRNDYNNGSFGTGNSFNPRADVTGAGLIVGASDIGQSISGDVTGGTTTTPTIAFGNFHVGDGSVTKNYAINNTGEVGPLLRGALQTSVNGGNITDARLSGSGVTAQNFGPISQEGSTGNYSVTFDPKSAGALTSQVVHVINNFDNVPDQNVTITGAAYRYAAPSTHTPEPVNFGVVHINETPSQSLTISNTAPNDGFSEKLDGSIGSTTGGVTATGSFSLLAPQSTSTALSVGIDTTSAGNKNGTATISLTSNGSGTSGLGTTALQSQTVNVTGQVNYFADPVVTFKSGSATLTMQSATSYTLSFGVVQQNSGNYLASFGVQNFLHDMTFQDSLGGKFDISMANSFGVTGAGMFSGIGPGSSLDPNVSFNSAMNNGTYTGTVLLMPISSNASGDTNLNTITLNLQATIVPEPATWALALAGAGLLVAGQRFRRKR